MRYSKRIKLFLGIVILFSISCRKSIKEPIKSSFASNLTIINDVFNDVEVVVAGNEGLQILVAFNRRLKDGTLLEMEKASSHPMPVMFKDQEGNNWDLFGKCTNGPREGERLKLLNSTVGFYFAFNSIFKGVEIYNGTDVDPIIAAFESDEWLIDEDYVFAIAGFDGIPSIEEPKFEVFRSRDFLVTPFHVGPEVRVTVIELNGEIRAYPHNILSKHEIVNDEINGTAITINFCPLTGTSYCWKRGSNSFGVSGLLYNNNLVLYDRDTESLWSQILGLSVFGGQKGNVPEAVPTIETTFETFTNLYDFQVKVLTQETGIPFSYDGNPYAEYLAIDNFLLFPVLYNDSRLKNKDRVIGIEVDGECKVYPFSSFR